MLSHLRAFLRICSFTLMMTGISVAVPLTRLFFGSQMAFNVHRRGMFVIHKVLGIKLHIIGNLPKDPAMIMCNHPSYYDIFFNIGHRPAVMIVADQFKNWPLVGWLGQGLNTIWVRRHSPEAGKKIREEIVTRIRAGLSIFACPEGRTSGSHDIHPVKPGLFVEAMRNEVPVVFLFHPISFRRNSVFPRPEGGLYTAPIQAFMECIATPNYRSRLEGLPPSVNSRRGARNAGLLSLQSLAFARLAFRTRTRSDRRLLN